PYGTRSRPGPHRELKRRSAWSSARSARSCERRLRRSSATMRLRTARGCPDGGRFKRNVRRPSESRGGDRRLKAGEEANKRGHPCCQGVASLPGSLPVASRPPPNDTLLQDRDSLLSVYESKRTRAWISSGVMCLRRALATASGVETTMRGLRQPICRAAA